MPRLLRRAAASASGLRLLLTATFGAAGFGSSRGDRQERAQRARVRSETDERLERLEL